MLHLASKSKSSLKANNLLNSCSALKITAFMIKTVPRLYFIFLVLSTVLLCPAGHNQDWKRFLDGGLEPTRWNITETMPLQEQLALHERLPLPWLWLTHKTCGWLKPPSQPPCRQIRSFSGSALRLLDIKIILLVSTHSLCLSGSFKICIFKFIVRTI